LQEEGEWKGQETYSFPNQEATTVTRVLVNEWISRYGAPDAIHSDQGKNFDPHSSRKFAISWECTRSEPHHKIHNLTV